VLQRRGGRGHRWSAGLPGHPAARLHTRRHGWRDRVERGGLAHHRRSWPRGQPGRAGAGRGVGSRLGGARTRGRPRCRQQQDHRVLHRERRPHGGAHGRLVLHGAHAHRGPSASAAPSGDLLPHRRGHRRHRGHQHPVRARSGDRAGRRHRDQPTHVTVIGPGIEGHRLPHRSRVGQAGRWSEPLGHPLLARRHARQVHPLRRLRRGQVRPVGLREVRRRRRPTGHPDARCRRGHEHWQDVQGGFPEVDPVA